MHSEHADLEDRRGREPALDFGWGQNERKTGINRVGQVLRRNQMERGWTLIRWHRGDGEYDDHLIQDKPAKADPGGKETHLPNHEQGYPTTNHEPRPPMTDAHDLNPGMAGVHGELVANLIPCVQTPECLVRGLPNLLPPAAKPADEGITGSRNDLHDDGVADRLVDVRDPPLVEEKVGESRESVEWRRCVEPTGTGHEDWIEEITWDRPL